jgi:hypothetical protein
MVSSLKIELNGTLITGRLDGADTFSVTLRQSDEDGRLAKSFSSELTFYDDGYSILKTELIDDPTGYSKEVKVKVWDSCCSEAVFEGVIKGDGIDWCEPGCFITANLVEDDDSINCVRSTLIWDNHSGFLSRSFVPIRYCIEIRPEFIQYVLIGLLFQLNLIFFSVILALIPAIFIIFGIIYLICNVIRAICSFRIRFRILRWTIQIGPFCSAPNCNTGFTNPITVINNLLDVFRDLNTAIIPCGRFHPSPFIRDYVENVCAKCGLTFQSSILKNPSSPYFNAVATWAQIKKGRKKDSNNFTLISDNLPVETLETLLNNYLKPTFNADYRIVNNVLVFERKDFFLSTSTWVDTETLLSNGDLIDSEICYTWTDKERYAFGRFEYSLDAQDYIGNEAKNRYNDIVDWNVPYSPSQTGFLQRTLPVGLSRHREDGIDTDVFTFHENALGGVINAVFFGAFSNYDKALLINQHCFFNPKFLIYDPNSGNDGEVKRDYSNAFCGGDPGAAPDERYNYPFWFLEGKTNNLYSNFHFIDNPRLPGTTNFDFKFSFRFTCDDYRSFDFAKTVRLIKGGTIVNGTVKEIEVDFVKRVISVSGIV